MAALKHECWETLNVSSGKPVSIVELAEACVAVAGSGRIGHTEVRDTYRYVPIPRITITSPSNFMILNEQETMITGTVMDALEVFVNGRSTIIKNGAFSLGVVKVETQDELLARTAEFLEKSDLIVAQEWLLTEFDWRIGVLERQPLYACR